MKEKTYFYKRYQNWYKLHNADILSFILFMIIGVFLAVTIPGTLRLSHDIHYNFKNDYEYLSEVAENIWDSDTKNLYILRKPDDVILKDVIYNNSGISFKCELKSFYNPIINPSISVKLSNDLETLIITHPSSFEYYIDLYISSFFIIAIIVLFLSVIVWVFFGIIRILSFLHKLLS